MSKADFIARIVFLLLAFVASFCYLVWVIYCIRFYPQRERKIEESCRLITAAGFLTISSFFIPGFFHPALLLGGFVSVVVGVLLRIVLEGKHIRNPIPEFPCPVCGYIVLARTTTECPICRWVPDPHQLFFPDDPGTANRASLVEAQRNFESFGASEKLKQRQCRKPSKNDKRDPGWRPLDLTTDVYLSRFTDSGRAKTGTYCPEMGSPYYWHKNYWLKSRDLADKQSQDES